MGWLMGFKFSFKRKPISDSITFDPSEVICGKKIKDSKVIKED